MMIDWQELEKEAYELQVQIGELETKREAVLRRDPDYSDYLEIHAEIDGGYDPPLTIRAFHALNDELSRLRPASDEDIEEWVREHMQRIQELERLLLA